ncbi:hypothetical protein B2G71_23620 [Novosphingobium sp. PC22D]|uniref:nuclear transport factor 2 family protein n=1 Tax=Novosphingobium sp. PC22D TaxID=1962403 RepID=UPI000BEFCAFC|nr:nuclear transport factor 2 family protein [Novosphingobium sp. PC22D]PEQ10201.1 hypothetical protein B2G71_23620 [Novosphingobium sp. PC22D]
MSGLDKSDSLAETIAAIQAREGVLQLQARYVDAVWRKDLDSICGCFTADAEWRIGGAVLEGRDRLYRQMSQRIFPRFRSIRMSLGSPFIEIVSGAVRANARTLVTENNVTADGTPILAQGTYFDRMVREHGTWKFSWRLFQTSYFGPPDMSGQFYEGNPDYGPVPNMPPLDAETINFTGMHD